MARESGSESGNTDLGIDSLKRYRIQEKKNRRGSNDFDEF